MIPPDLVAAGWSVSRLDQRILVRDNGAVAVAAETAAERIRLARAADARGKSGERL